MSDDRLSLLKIDPRAAVRALKKADTKLARLIERIGPFKLVPDLRLSPFEALIRAIVFQQLTGKAAATILSRIQACFGNRFPTPAELALADEGMLRGAGLSGAKMAALKDLASRALGGQVPSRRRMAAMSNQEIITCLDEIRGVGPWTVEMMLIFQLGRADVLAVDDFALKKAVMALYKLKGPPCPERFREIGERWRPYRSVACWYLWRSLDL